MKLINCSLTLVALLGFVSSAGAQTFFPNNATINYNITNGALVGYDSLGNPSSPTVNLVTGGNVTPSLSIYNNSTVNATGGFSNALDTNQTSTLNVSGGSFGNTALFDSSTANISGGNFATTLSLLGHSVANIVGGTIANGIFVSNQGIVNFYGSGLGDTLIDPNVNNNGSYSLYSLFGTLTNGTNITGKSLYIRNGSTATVVFHNATSNAVPEPGFQALLEGAALLGAGGFARRRFRRK